MSDTDNSMASEHQAFIHHLESTGFFQQIGNLETSLKSIVGEIETFSQTSNKRQEESENIAAHILAMEAVITGLLKKYPLDEKDLVDQIDRQAAALTGDGKPNPTVEAIALDLLRKAQTG